MTVTSLIRVRSSSLRSRAVVVSAVHRRGRSRIRRARACRSSVGEGFGATGLELGELAQFALELGERLLEPALERAGDEAVLRLAGVELALRALGFELGALDRELLPVQALVVLALELADRLRRWRAPWPG